MAIRLFGTDGVRGRAGDDLTAALALELSVAAATELGGGSVDPAQRPCAVVGRDPRASGEYLEAAVVAGLASAGVDVVRLGVLPTPAVAYLTDALNADLGVMLSASHNPAPDNGIKFFSRGGHKLPDEVEDAIEARVGKPAPRITGAAVGRVTEAKDAIERYVRHVNTASTQSLDGLRIVVDCAHGAASTVAPEVFRRAGADVVEIGTAPDGHNINAECGSTAVEAVASAVVEHRADAGLAFDGDADRCLAVTADGSVVDGDQILAILAGQLHARGQLVDDTVVVTVMSNLGLRIAMRQQGISVVETAVGDRYVLEAMRAGSYSLGGEQSGHVVLLDHATTGDGVLTGLFLLAAVAAEGRSLGELSSGCMTRLPQVLVNVRDVDKARVDSTPAVASAVAEEEAALGAEGRVLLRPSGTEPKVRVMVEAPTEERAQAAAERLAEVVRSELACR
ncbi:phosphoglucosamine mutase [Lipingzhangella sp. LS1_29]|uniref:Phosphoglucosamine mutase n=1 Tax=Lipingzhangella rawalii TaxID=2055835 RepID=A0ABU2H3P0_9ACTN|nr:phosphoglucosamine mutase [Lipingzhangella rawalii]MDS1269921.1 phosphoglucosamine mutase [Lipingzhangella rawalii]